MSRPFNRSHRAHSGGGSGGGGSGGGENPAPLKARGLEPLPALLHSPVPGRPPTQRSRRPPLPSRWGRIPGTAPRRDPPRRGACGGQGPACGVQLHLAPFERRAIGPPSARPIQPAHLLRRAAPAVFTGRAPGRPGAGAGPAPGPPRPRPAGDATLPGPCPASLEPGHRVGEGPGFPSRAAGTRE